MYVVTGGAGFIGSNLVKYLNSKGIKDIIIVDDVTDARKLDNIKHLDFVSYVDVDASMDRFLKLDITKVFHIGGISSTTETNGKHLMQYNYASTISWQTICEYKKIPLVYTSSASVYGNSDTFTETDAYAPLNAYATSKMLSEKALTAFGPQNTWIFRPFNVYGPNEDHKDNQASPISKFKREYDEHGCILVFKDSESIKRDFICVDDVVKIMVDHTDKNPGTYNLGTGTTETFYNIAKAIGDLVHEMPFPENLKDKYQYYSCANTDKLRANLIGDYQFTTIKEYLCR